MRLLLLPAAFAALLPLTLTACGGGGGDSAPPPVTSTPAGPTALKTTDTTVGTGATAANGSRVQVAYTGWLYDAKATNLKGTKFDASPPNQPFVFVVGATTGEAAIAGFSQGVAGMKVGGKRTIEIPSALGYGSQGIVRNGTVVIPPNAGLVFDVELLKICASATAC